MNLLLHFQHDKVDESTLCQDQLIELPYERISAVCVDKQPIQQWLVNYSEHHD